MGKKLERLRKIRNVSLATAIVSLAIMILLIAMPVSAKTVTDSDGNTYIYKSGHLQTGWFKYHGSYYYGYKTDGQYPKGSIAKNVYKVRGKRLYYFTGSGKRLYRNTRYITINKASGSVHYIHAPGIMRRMRYNANRHRWQIRNLNTGRYEDVGMETWPMGLIDIQE